jgi:hypothetical protein
MRGGSERRYQVCARAYRGLCEVARAPEVGTVLTVSLPLPGPS